MNCQGAGDSGALRHVHPLLFLQRNQGVPVCGGPTFASLFSFLEDCNMFPNHGSSLFLSERAALSHMLPALFLQSDSDLHQD